jgi:hypothetical protein
MRNNSDKSCRENPNAHFIFNNLLLENRALCEIMLKIILAPFRPQMTIWRKRIACWITKTSNEHSEYVIPTVLPQQKWLWERA